MAARYQRHIGFPALLGLGASLARRGPLAFISLLVCGITIFIACVVAISFAGRGEGAPAHDVPLVTSSAIAWGGGFLLAFSAAASALRRDRTEGIHALFVARTTSIRGYLVARVGGLAALLAFVVAGGTALTGMLAILASLKIGALPLTAQASAAAVAYGFAFALVLAPVAFAALGARTRFGGYLFLILVLVLPELLTSALDKSLPAEVLEVCAIPSALAALRASIAPGTTDILRFVRAAVALFVFASAAMLWIRRDLARMEARSVSLIQASDVTARGVLGVKLTRLSLEAGPGVLAIVGRPTDGTTLLFDVLDRTIAPKLGTVRAPARIARVTLDAPLPDAMRVDEVCTLSSDLRGEARVDALAPLDLASLARRETRSLGVDERRAVALAIALASKAELILIEEPLASLSVATRVATDAVRERAKTGCVIVATASPRDATRVGDRIAVLVDGVLTPIEESNTVSRDAGSLVVVVAAAQGKEGAATLIGELGRQEAVVRIDSGAFAAGRATALTVHGNDLAALAKAVTRAIASSKVNVDLVEPSVMPLDAIRAAIASLAAGGSS